MDTIEEIKEEEWIPTNSQILEKMKEQGWPIFSDIRYDHIDNEEEQATLRTAVSKAREYTKEIEDGKPLGMILVANNVDGDMDRTGYGCGKTTLAKIIHYSNSYYFREQEARIIYQIHPYGRFYSSREVMGLFDKADFDERATFRDIRKLLVIDDLGREGSLKWEKRDPEMQLQEKQDRYYSIINHCYNVGVSLVITSNLTSREMATFLGGASWSRLLQMVPKRYRVNMTGIRDMRPLLAENDWF